mgnify:CR=1 FL=1
MRIIHNIIVIITIVLFVYFVSYIQSPQFQTYFGLMSKTEADLCFSSEVQFRLRNKKDFVFIDPWGTPTKFGMFEGHQTIFSAGPDGIWDSKDDLRQLE